MKYALLDRDGTLIYEPPKGQVTEGNVRILEGVPEGLQQLQAHDFKLVVVSNQESGPTFDNRQEQFDLTQNELERMLLNYEIEFFRVFVCCHTKEDQCKCRKPETGMVDPIRDQITPQTCFMVGDRETDGGFAANLNIPFILMNNNGQFPHIDKILELFSGIGDC